MTSSSKNLSAWLAIATFAIALPLSACKSGGTDTEGTDEQPTETSNTETTGSQPAETSAKETSPAETANSPEQAAACDDKIRAAAFEWIAKTYPEDFDVTRDDAKDRTEFDDFGDLNADGKKERRMTVFVGASDTIQVVASTTACDSLLGKFYTTGIEAESTSTAGFKDISSWRKDGCAGLSGTYKIYKYDAEKKAYAESKSVSCDCDPSPDRDELCPAIPE